MEPVNVSLRRIHGGTVRAFSSQLDDAHPAASVLADDGYWSSQKSNSIVPEYITIDYGDTVPVDCIEIGAAPAGRVTFPQDFRLEASVDGGVWRVVQSERKYELEDGPVYRLDLPLALTRFIRLYITRPRKTGAKFFSEIGFVRAGIGGAREVSASSHSSYEHAPARLLDGADGTYWESEVRTGPSREHVEIDLGRTLQVNGVWLTSAGIIPHGFPESFSIEVSADRTVWAPLVEEKFFNAQPATTYFHEAAVTPARYVRVEMGTVPIEAKTFGARLAGFAVSAAPFEFTHTHNIGELTPQASIFQAGVVRLARDGDDSLGTVVQASDRRLRDATTVFKGVVQLAEDGDDRPGLAVQSSDSRFKPASELRPGVVRLAYDRENKPGVAVQANDSRLAEATETTYGIVRLCPDGVYSEMSVVRGADSRLKKATTTAHGISRLAADGENNPECVVQGNDRRLRDGTTINKGIVELAEDGETADGVAVQGSDRRLKDATTTSKGIVELAEDGEDRECVAVQGNDRRLKDAGESSKGIMRFAKDGEDSPLAAVQGSDRRLKNATTTARGIVELAEDGEDADCVAVQGSDRRLKNATTMTKGIVELAEDGEDAAGVVVQGNDRRLKSATEDAPGIVVLAADGEFRRGAVLQSDDTRLSDPREPLPHTHNYAPLVHAYSSHSGTIRISEKCSEAFTGVTPPSDASAVVYARNESPGEGAIGVLGIAAMGREIPQRSWGVLGHGAFAGVRGQSVGADGDGPRGCGVLGVSRFGAGGVFASEHAPSLVVDGYGSIGEYDDTVNLVGNGEALLVRGSSEFLGRVRIHNRSREGSFPVNIVEMFEVDDIDYISPGDILTVSALGGGQLSRSSGAYMRSVIGIVSGNPTLVFDNTGASRMAYPVALSGWVLCKVDARNRPIRPGDLIVTSETPGCGMAGEIDSFAKIGTVIGKALDGLSEGMGTIPVFVTHL
jgi:hypothetical protein